MVTWDQLTLLHMDALREIGNIGAGNAATALAEMLHRKINMDVPKTGIMPFDDINRLVGSEEELVACIDFEVTGRAPGHILFLLDAPSAYAMVDMLMGQPAGTTTALDAMGISALQEVGNILTGSFLNAFAQVTGMGFASSVPAFAFDMLGAVLSTALVEGGFYADQVLVIETQFYEADIRLNGHFFLLPRTESLEIILRSLGMSV